MPLWKVPQRGPNPEVKVPFAGRATVAAGATAVVATPAASATVSATPEERPA